MKSAGKARSNGLYRHIRTSKEIIRNLLNDYNKTLNEKFGVCNTLKVFLRLQMLKYWNIIHTVGK